MSIFPRRSLGLRRRGVDSFTVQEAGRAGLSDADQIAFARAAGRVIVTMDSDFLVRASQGVSHAGIVYANPNRSIGELITASMLLFEVLTSAEMTNHVEFL